MGDIWKIDGGLSARKWSLHFSKDPVNVFNFYEIDENEVIGTCETNEYEFFEDGSVY